MAWDINQINSQFMANLPNAGAAFQEGQDDSFKRRVVANQFQQAQQQQALALQRQQQKQAAVQAAIARPSAQAFADLQTLYPEDREAFQNAWKTRAEDEQKTELRELAGIHGYLTNGFPDKAKASLERRRDAELKAGGDTSDYDDMIAAIDEDPKRAQGMTAYMLAQIAGPEKLGDTLSKIGEDRRADELQPGLVRKGVAEAVEGEAKATYAPQVIESELASEESTRLRNAAQTANEVAQLALGWAKQNLDADALATNTQLKLDEMAQSGQKVEGASLTALTEAVGSSQQNQALAERATSLADRIEASPLRGAGWRSWAGEASAWSTGTQDGVSALRGELERLKNSQAIKSLPPGPATDADITMAKQGFPPADAGKAHIVSFLRGMAKMQAIAAAADDRKANWISANGNLGTAKRDQNIAGVQVPAGTTFSEFNRNSVKNASRGQAPARGYLEKWGNFKAPASVAKR